jgi:imidazolonepropionase
MGAQLEATAISHLEEVSKKGIEAMAMSGTVAVLLPTTAYIMHLRPPPARQLIEAAVPVALGSDFNPNAHCLAMVRHGNFQDSELQRHFLHLQIF